MEKVAKIQISTIFHPAKEYSYKLALDWMRDQTWPNSEFWIDFHGGPYGQHSELKKRRERCRLQALESDVDAMVFFDCDTIAPLDGIARLLEVPGDIISGIYFSRIDGARAVIWKHSDNPQIFINSEHVSEIDGAGMGFCLIKRPVLEACTFDYAVPDDDYPFWNQAKAAGFRAMSLNTLRCKHYTSETDCIYRPYGMLTSGEAHKYTVRCAQGITINGKFYKGDVTESAKLIEEIKRIDKPYREGELTSTDKVLNFVPKGTVDSNAFLNSGKPQNLAIKDKKFLIENPNVNEFLVNKGGVGKL